VLQIKYNDIVLGLYIMSDYINKSLK